MVSLMVLAFTACSNGTDDKNGNNTDGNTAGDDAQDGAPSQDTVVLQCGMTPSTDSSYYLGVEHMNELLAEYTDGTLQIEIFADSLLGGERDLYEGIGLGTVDMCVISNGVLGNFVDDFYILDLPYLFEDSEQVYDILDGEIGDYLFEQCLEQGVRGLAYWECGWRQISSSDTLIEHPEDVAGLKVRTMENSIHMASWEVLDVIATPMAAGDVYTALQQKTLDGQEMPLLFFKSHQFQDVQNYICIVRMVYSPSLVFIGDALYNSLSPEHQEALTRACTETTAWQREYSQSFDEEYIKELEADGKTITYADIDEWREAVSPVYDEFIPDMNRDLIQNLFDQLGREFTW